MLTHAVHPGIVTLGGSTCSLCASPGDRSWRSCRAATPCHRCTARARRTEPRHAAPVRPPVGEIATRDRIHIITGGGIVLHFTHRTPCDRVTRPTPRRSTYAVALHSACAPRAFSLSLSLYLCICLSVSPCSYIGWIDSDFTQHRDRMVVRRGSFLIKDRRDQGMIAS